MRRRDFLKTAGAVGAGSTVLAGAGSTVLAGAPSRLMATTDEVDRLPVPSAALVEQCKRILEQNLLRAGETFVLASPFSYDEEYIHAMLTAAGEIGAAGAHVAVFPKIVGEKLEMNLTPFHWETYAMADLLISTSLGNEIGAPGATTAYASKVADHPYRTDFEYISRPGSKTRWLALGYTPAQQRRYFPTRERRERTLRGARLLDENRGEIRVTSDAGTDWRCSNEGRPGHAQYGIADLAGRWDNFGYGCVACGPQEESAEGRLVLQPGDIVRDFYPAVIDEPVTLNFEGGYVTSIEGGRRAREFETLLASYNDREAYGIGHFGWGTHENTALRGPEDVGHYHHNRIGSLLFALGMNYAHGLGGAEMGYSGLGDTRRRAPNHTHFTMFGCDVYVGGSKVIERGVVSPAAGGFA